MRAATEGSLPPVMPQGNLVEVLGREVRQGSPGELMVESTPSRQRRPPCKTNKEMSDEAADAAALTYLITYLLTYLLTVLFLFCSAVMCSCVLSCPLFFGLARCLRVVLPAASVCLVCCCGVSCCLAWLCRFVFVCCAVWCSVVPWCVTSFCAVSFFWLRCFCRVLPRQLLWRVVVLCPSAWCCVVLLCCLRSECCRSFCRVSGFLSFPGTSCAVICWRACVLDFCAVQPRPSGAGWCCVSLPVAFGCSLLGPAVRFCLPVPPGGVFRLCCPCLAACLAALWFRVVCLDAPLPCVASSRDVLSRGGVPSFSAVSLRFYLCLLFFSSFETSAKPVRCFPSFFF